VATSLSGVSTTSSSLQVAQALITSAMALDLAMAMP
jgi:hypothetical protein